MIRAYENNDLQSCISLFKDCVLKLCKKDYSQGELEAWIDIDEKAWEEKLLQNQSFVYVKNNLIIAFASLNYDEKLLDLFYVHHNFANQGYGRILLDFILKIYPFEEIFVYASLSAKGFFEHFNFKVIRKNIALRKNQSLKNFLMKKEF